MNAAGLEATNATFVEGKTLPLLQDTTAANVWSSWKVTYRDVVILDAANHREGAYNLTDHDLSVAANRDELKSMLRAAHR